MTLVFSTFTLPDQLYEQIQAVSQKCNFSTGKSARLKTSMADNSQFQATQ